MDQAIKDKYETYFKAPESYPNYKKEWLKFWESRCRQLQNKGIDPKHYDFREEWKKSFHSRLNDLEFLEKSEMQGKLFKEYMKQPKTPSPSRQKSISPVRVPEKKTQERRNYRRSSPSPKRTPIFQRLGRSPRTQVRKRVKLERSRSRSRRHASRSRSRSPRRRTKSPSRDRKSSVKDRLQMMSRNEFNGSRKLSISGKVLCELFSNFLTILLFHRSRSLQTCLVTRLSPDSNCRYTLL